MREISWIRGLREIGLNVEFALNGHWSTLLFSVCEILKEKFITTKKIMKHPLV